MTLLVLKALSEIKTNLKGCESKPIVRLFRKCKAGRNEPFSSGGAGQGRWAYLTYRYTCQGLEGTASPDGPCPPPGLPPPA